MTSLIISLLHTRHIYPRRPWQEGRARGPCTENAAVFRYPFFYYNAIFISFCVCARVDFIFFVRFFTFFSFSRLVRSSNCDTLPSLSNRRVLRFDCLADSWLAGHFGVFYEGAVVVLCCAIRSEGGAVSYMTPLQRGSGDGHFRFRRL